MTSPIELVAPEILKSVVEGVKRSRELPVRPLETPLGSLAGKKSNDVAQVAATIIRDLLFVDIKNTFDVICNLYRSRSSASEADHWVRLAGEIAEHNLTVWTQAGAILQLELMDRIRGFSVAERGELKALIVPVLRHVLATELSETTWDFDCVTFHRGEIAPSDLLRRLRQDVITILHEYDAAVGDDKERAELIDMFSAAMKLRSASPSPPPDLAAIVYANAVEIVGCFTLQVQRWPFELRQKVEHNLLWKYRHHGKSPPPELTNDAAERARVELVQAIHTFRAKVNEEAAFTTYKLLVGFQSVFPPAWDDSKFDHVAEEAYRKAEVENVVARIDADNAVEWLAPIRRCAATKSDDLATFPMFTYFLERLAVVKSLTRNSVMFGVCPCESSHH